MNGFVMLKETETSRFYWYPDGSYQVFYNITKIRVSQHGYHMLESGEGRKFIVAPGWRHIEITAKAWTTGVGQEK